MISFSNPPFFKVKKISACPKWGKKKLSKNLLNWCSSKKKIEINARLIKKNK